MTIFEDYSYSAISPIGRGKRRSLSVTFIVIGQMKNFLILHPTISVQTDSVKVESVSAMVTGL